MKAYLISITLLLSILLLSFSPILQKNTKKERPPQRPNILWIVSEDNSPFLGCYGDSRAFTPNLDQLAAEGMLYTRAFANAPVCAPARNTIITGTYASGNGTENMRSNYPLIDDHIRFFPSWLRKIGYYTTNQSKKDYNTSSYDEEAWNESSGEAHYSKRESNQPFFHVVNIGVSHESGVHENVNYMPPRTYRHDPKTMKLPAYHPNTPEIRDDWAWYYDRVSQMDSTVGTIIQKLKEDNLYEETIIFYYADHGGVLGRSKRYLYDSGIHVPFMVRVPEKYKDLYPDYQAATQNDRVISFVDLAATMLSLAGATLPQYLDGHPFNLQANTQEYAHAYASRMDERPDLSRAIRDKDYLLIRNFFPEQPNGTKIDYLWRQKAIRSWEETCQKGNCNEAQAAFWKPKQPLELFYSSQDQDNIKNLAQDKKYQDIRQRLDQALRQWMITEKDKGIVHELERRDAKGIQAVQDLPEDAYRELLALAMLVSEGKEIDQETLGGFLNKNQYFQYWALHYLFKMKTPLSENLLQKVQKLSESLYPSVAVAARAVWYQHRPDTASKSKVRVLLHSDDHLVRFYMLHYVSKLGGQEWQNFKEIIAKYAQEEDYRPYYKRLAGNILARQK